MDLTGWPHNIDAVSYVEQPGTVTDSNTGHQCRSGQEFVIKLIGTFDNIADGGGDPSEPHTAALVLTADASSGATCLVGYIPKGAHADPGSVILFQR